MGCLEADQRMSKGCREVVKSCEHFREGLSRGCQHVVERLSKVVKNVVHVVVQRISLS